MFFLQEIYDGSPERLRLVFPSGDHWDLVLEAELAVVSLLQAVKPVWQQHNQKDLQVITKCV